MEGKGIPDHTDEAVAQALAGLGYEVTDIGVPDSIPPDRKRETVFSEEEMEEKMKLLQKTAQKGKATEAQEKPVRISRRAADALLEQLLGPLKSRSDSK